MRPFWKEDLYAREPEDVPAPDPVMGAPEPWTDADDDDIQQFVEVCQERDAWKLAAQRNLEAGLAISRRALKAEFRAQDTEKALARAELWLAVFVWAALLLTVCGIVAGILHYAPVIDQWRLL